MSKDLAPETGDSLSSNLVRLFSNCGVMKAAVDAGLRTATPTGH
jgi:hypothetical protein